jgi:hypothetical protein
MRRTQRRGRASLIAAALALLTMLVLVPIAQAAVSVSRAELNNGQLRVEGTGAQPGSTVTVRSSASSAAATADSKGAFRVESSSFSAPDCRVTVGDPVSSTSTTLSGCSTSTSPPATSPPPPTTSVAVSSLVVQPAKTVQGNTATGTVTLSGTPSGSVTVFLSADGQVSIPASVTITAPATSATFPITTFVLERTFLIHVSAGVSTTEAQTTFFQVPTAQTDIITIPTATLSKNGDLQVSATSDNAGVTVRAFFGETQVGVLRNNGGGKFSGSFKVNAQDGVVTLRSNLGGCSQRSVNRPTGWQYC